MRITYYRNNISKSNIGNFHGISKPFSYTLTYFTIIREEVKHIVVP